tara:strand:- start:2042 stop:2269 length:228 start_codon:yes stop_codon:yes gene_type:complete
VASAAPEFKPNKLIATANSKRLERRSWHQVQQSNAAGLQNALKGRNPVNQVSLEDQGNGHQDDGQRIGKNHLGLK